MEIAATANPAPSTAAGSRIGLADNFDNFLKLLTTQLQSQDPLSPLDATQFTEQLVQFTGVEQAIKTNDVLGQLVALVRADQVTRAVDYLGAEVEANGQSVRLDGNTPATVHYRLDQPAAAATISIYNEAGRLVRTQAGRRFAGRPHGAVGRARPSGRAPARWPVPGRGGGGKHGRRRGPGQHHHRRDRRWGRAPGRPPHALGRGRAAPARCRDHHPPAAGDCLSTATPHQRGIKSAHP